MVTVVLCVYTNLGNPVKMLHVNTLHCMTVIGVNPLPNPEGEVKVTHFVGRDPTSNGCTTLVGIGSMVTDAPN